MDNLLTPPTAALANLTIADDSLRHPTTALNIPNPEPRTIVPLFPAQESMKNRLKRLRNAVALFYGKRKCCYPPLSLDDQSRHNQRRLQAFRTMKSRGLIKLTKTENNMLYYERSIKDMRLGGELRRLMCVIAEEKPELKDKLMILHQHLLQGTNEQLVYALVYSLK